MPPKQQTYNQSGGGPKGEAPSGNAQPLYDQGGGSNKPQGGGKPKPK
jgi:hypothetical protein